MRLSRIATLSALPPRSVSWSSCVPTAPLSPRTGYRAISPSSRSKATLSSCPNIASRFPSVVGCAGTLCVRPVIIRSRCSSARRASARSAAAAFIRTILSDWKIWSCSTFSVTSRLVRPRWMNCLFASSENSSIRALTSWSVACSRFAIDSRSMSVMERRMLPLRDRLEVDVGLDALVVLDRLRGYRDPEVPLGLHDRDPEVALEEDLSARGPDIPHRHRRVALREDVEDGLAGGGVGRLVHGRPLSKPSLSANAIGKAPAAGRRVPLDGEAADGHVAQHFLLAGGPADDLLERVDEFPLVVDQAPERRERGGARQLPQVPRILGEDVERALLPGCVAVSRAVGGRRLLKAGDPPRAHAGLARVHERPELDQDPVAVLQGGEDGPGVAAREEMPLEGREGPLEVPAEEGVRHLEEVPLRRVGGHLGDAGLLDPGPVGVRR